MPKAQVGKGRGEGKGKGRPALSKGHLMGFLAVLGFISLLAFSIKTFVFARPGNPSIIYPFDGALFPPEIIPPTIWWEDRDSDANRWRVAIEFDTGAEAVRVDVDTTSWTPSRKVCRVSPSR